MADEMGAKKSKSSGFECTLVHGAKKYKIELPGLECTLRDLSDAAYLWTNVPSSRQRLIFKGKSLTKIDQSLLENNIKNGAKIMLIGKMNDPEEENIILSISKVEKEIEVIENQFRQTEEDFNSLKQGFMSEEMTNETLGNIEKSLKHHDGNLMKCIETLDMMDIGTSFQEAKAKKKKLIKTVQMMHDKVDSLEGKIKEYRMGHTL